MSIVVGTPVPFGSKVEVYIHGFLSSFVIQSSEATVACNLGTIACDSAMESIADVKRGRKTTIMLKSLATSSAYATKWGEPIQSYVETIQGLPITASAIYNFRVYAYNGRYKSKSVQTLVQNRAVMRPEKPLYFSQIAQENVHVTMVYTNLAGQQSSGPEPGVASPSQAKAGMPTRIRVKFTPKRQINELETLDIHLPKFKGPGYLSINNDASILLLAHSYQPYGSDACLCDLCTQRVAYKRLATITRLPAPLKATDRAHIPKTTLRSASRG